MKKKIIMAIALSAMVAAPVIGVKYETNLHNDFVAVQNIKSSSKDLTKNLAALNTKQKNFVANKTSSTNALNKSSKDLSILSNSIKTKGLKQNLVASAPASKIMNQQFANDIVNVENYVEAMTSFVKHAPKDSKTYPTVAQNYIKNKMSILNQQHPEYAVSVGRISNEFIKNAPRNMAAKLNGPGGLRYNMHAYYYFFDGSLNSDGSAHLSHGDTYIHAWNAHVEIGAKSGSKYGQGIYMDKDHPLQVKIAASMQHTVSFEGNMNSLQMGISTITTQYKDTELDINAKGPATDPTVWGQMYQTNAKTNVRTSERIGMFGVYNWNNHEDHSVGLIVGLFGSVLLGICVLGAMGGFLYYIIGTILVCMGLL